MWCLLLCLSVLRSFVLFFLCGVVIAIEVGRCCHRHNIDIAGPIEASCTVRWGRGFRPVQIDVVVQQGHSSLSSPSFQLCRGLGVVVVVAAVAVVVGVAAVVGVVVVGDVVGIAVGIVVVVGVAAAAVLGTVVAVAVVAAVDVAVVVVGCDAGVVAVVEIVAVAGSAVGAAPVVAEPVVPVSSLQLDLGSRG